MRSKITIMNMALAASGQAGKIITEASTGPEFSLMEQWYPEIVGGLFEQGGFRSGKVRVALTTRSDGDFGFNDTWLLPDDILYLMDVYVGGFRWLRDWERNGRHLYLDSGSNVEIEYIKAGAEHLWPAALAKAVAFELEALIRRSINEEMEESRQSSQDADFEIARAGVNASRQHAGRRPFRRGHVMTSRAFGPQRYDRRGDT